MYIKCFVYIDIQGYGYGVRHAYTRVFIPHRSRGIYSISRVYNIGKVGHGRPSLLGGYNKKRNIAREGRGASGVRCSPRLSPCKMRNA